MEYKINYSDGALDNMLPAISELEQKIARDIDNGWKPLGGVSTMMGRLLFQAMIKEHKENKEPKRY